MSYNTTPGWSAAIPLRHLMRLHLDLASSRGAGLRTRIDQAIAFAENLAGSNANYFRANPLVAEKLKGFKTQNRNYLAHEFFNADWHPMPFSEAAGYLEGAKLSYGASANLASHIEACSLSARATATSGRHHPSGVARIRARLAARTSNSAAISSSRARAPSRSNVNSSSYVTSTSS